jgi:hypothetical protein
MKLLMNDFATFQNNSLLSIVSNPLIESMLKGDKDKIVPYSIGIHFKVVQNSNSNY